jgi:hypothetical protein
LGTKNKETRGKGGRGATEKGRRSLRVPVSPCLRVVFIGA